MTVDADLATLRPPACAWACGDCSRCRRNRAADRVEAEISRLESELTEWRTSIATEALTDRALAAEAEVARLRQERDQYEVWAEKFINEPLRADLARLRDGLATILHRAETRRTAVRMDGSEEWAVPLAGEVAGIARALLDDSAEPRPGSAKQKPEDGAAIDESDLKVEPWGRGDLMMDGVEATWDAAYNGPTAFLRLVHRNPRGVRITHLPTGVSVEWDDEKSQLGNREVALRMLRERLAENGAAQTCSECGRDLHGYRGPRCRYCDGAAE